MILSLEIIHRPYIEQLLFGTAFQYQKDDASLVALKATII